MSAPAPHLLVGFIKLIEACAETALEMRKHGRVELLPRVRVGTGRRDAKDIAQRVKDFIERILKRQFMTSQNHQTKTTKREQAQAREVLRTLPTRGDHDRTLQTGTHLHQENLFFFCSITDYLQELYR